MFFKLLLAVLFPLTNGQFLFDNQEICEYQNLSNQVDLSFPRTTNRISTETLDIFINLCSPINDVQGCDKGAYSCVFGKGQKITNGGSIILDRDGQGKLLELENNGTTCKESIKFRTFVHVFSRFDNASVLEAAWIKDCEIHVRLPDINYKPECTVSVNDFLINLMPLRSYKDIIVDVPNNSYKIAVSICRPAKACGDIPNIMGCEIKNNTGLILKDQHFSYDERTKIIQIRSHDNSIKKQKKTFKLNLHCNWNVGLSNITTYSKRNRKEMIVDVDSKYGCVKFPMKCEMNDDVNNIYFYNLSALYSTKGLVIRVPDGKLRLNICGPLNFYTLNECSDKHSQVCLFQNNTYLSLGSTSSDLSINRDDNNLQFLELNFYYGSVCPHNNSKSFNSKIIFKCSFTEENPVLKEINGCEYTIHWNTKYACPQKKVNSNEIIVPKTFNCSSVSNGIIDFNIAKLMGVNEDKVVEDVDGLKYYINLCRSVLIEECQNSVFCFQNTSEPNSILSFKSLGSSPHFYIENDTLFSTFKGGRLCQQSPKFLFYNGSIKFVCSNKNKLSFIGTSNSNCTHNFVWESNDVCKKQEIEVEDCFYTENKTQLWFDFNNVTHKQFFVEKDSKKYQFNICKKENLMEGIETSIGPPTMKFDNCTYSLIYNLTNTEVCSSPSLVLKLQCDRISNNEHFTVNNSTQCIIKVDFWTTIACNDDVIKKFCPHEDKTSKNPISSIAKREQLIPTQAKKTEIQKVYKDCTINFNTTSYLNLKDISPTIVPSKDANYSIGLGGICNDFICRNKVVIGSISQICPNVAPTVLEPNTMEVVFLGHNSSNCLNNLFTTHLSFVCNKSVSTPNIYKEAVCNVYINFPIYQACDKNEDSTSINYNLYITVGTAILVICALIGLIYLCIKNRDNHYFRIRAGCDKSKVYLKDTSC